MCPGLWFHEEFRDLFGSSDVPVRFRTIVLVARPVESRAGFGVSVLPIAPFSLPPGPKWNRMDRILTFTIFVVLTVMVVFWSTGLNQIGYRFHQIICHWYSGFLMRSRELSGGLNALMLS